MFYLILQILWFMIAAAVIGFVLGWFCRSLEGVRRREAGAIQVRASEGELEGQRERLEARLAEAANTRKALQEELAQVHQAAEADGKSLRKLERDHKATLVRLEAREREVARLKAELEARHGQTALPLPPHTVTSPLTSGPLEPEAPQPDDAREPAGLATGSGRKR